jgi:hypothetical protein
LPKPAGADTSVSFVSAPRFSRSISLGREISAGRDVGTYTFVSSRGAVTQVLVLANEARF